MGRKAFITLYFSRGLTFKSAPFYRLSFNYGVLSKYVEAFAGWSEITTL